MSKITTRMLTYLAFLTALEVVLSRFLSINAWNVKIGFSFVPIVIAAMLFGPVPAGIVGALGDFLGATLFPIGPYFPGFTLTAFLTGLVFGVFLYKKQTILRTVSAVLIQQIFLSLLLNTYWISVLYSSPYVPLLKTRLIQVAVLGPVQFLVITAIVKVLLERLNLRGRIGK